MSHAKTNEFAADTAASPAQSGLALLEQRCRQFECRLTLTTEHPRDFLLARLAGDFIEIGKGTAVRYILCHHKMRRSGCGDLWQMRNADYLMVAAQCFHLCSHRVRDLATDI